MRIIALVTSMIYLIVFLFIMGLGIYLAMTDDSWGIVIVPCWIVINGLNQMRKDRDDGIA